MNILDHPAGLLAAWIALMSLVAFAAMGIDKRRAVRGRYRIPEARLFLWALLGGGPGGLLGMRVFRHKTKHWYFVLGFSLIAAFQLAACAYLALRR